MTIRLPRFTGEEPCTEIGAEPFFKQNNTTHYADLAMLRRLCGSCEMQAECLDYALHVNVLGVWGGTTEAERRRIRKERNIIPEPNYA